VNYDNPRQYQILTGYIFVLIRHRLTFEV